MPLKKARADEAAVTLCTPPGITRADAAIETANAYSRTALLAEPDVIEHLADLADLANTARISAAIATRAGVPLGQRLAAEDGLRYERALEGSPLRQHFERAELEDMVAGFKKRRALGVWGLSVPVNSRGRGYGRQKQRARAMSFDSIELAVADLVRRHLNPERPSPHLDARTEHWGGASDSLRKIRKRFRELPDR
jgi:hypothetical protein